MKSPETRETLREAAVVACVLLLTLAVSMAHSQVAVRTDVAFEVVSIKRNTSTTASRARLEPGRFSAVGVPIFQVVRQAYGLLDVQVGPVPDWVRSEGYDVLAKAPEDVNVARAHRRAY
jgi:hypothetical protein